MSSKPDSLAGRWPREATNYSTQSSCCSYSFHFIAPSFPETLSAGLDLVSSHHCFVLGMGRKGEAVQGRRVAFFAVDELVAHITFPHTHWLERTAPEAGEWALVEKTCFQVELRWEGYLKSNRMDFGEK